MCKYGYIMSTRTTRVRTASDLGAALVQARRERGLSQQELAEQAGVSRRWLSSVERGQNLRAEFTLVLQLLRALGTEFTMVDRPPASAEERLLASFLAPRHSNGH
jgi:HTH-type transcriptional regulator / antitoxin HipB